MSVKIGMRCYVSGKVQGVWFRATTKEQAERWPITGWAKNLPDGRVEVLAYGDAEQLVKLHEWLKQGPPRANVEHLSYEEMAWRPCDGFRVL